MGVRARRTIGPMPGPVNVLLIGGGGREHAIAAALVRSPRLGRLWLTHPKNAGLATLGHGVDVPVGIREIYRLQQFCDHNKVGLVIVGPEDPLAEGYADKLAAPGRMVFGPTAEGAQIESDKAWCKQLLRSASVPTGEARVFTDAEPAWQFIESRALEDPAIARLHQRVAPATNPALRRQVIQAFVRLGRASVERSAVAQADLTTIKASGLWPMPGGDAASMLAEAAATARAYLKPRADLPVVKATGLAKGKGVIVPGNLAEAVDAVDAMLVRKVFGDAGRTVMVEERLTGREVSVLAVVDGRNIVVLPPCQDHKRLGDGDQGPNTGGMGAFCPAGTVDEPTMGKIVRDILVPTVDALRREGIRYTGVLYAGLMLTPGGPKVLEYNCRFGDPECQPLMARLASDPIDLFEAACSGSLDQIDVRWDERAACCVVLAAEGYPEKPKAGAVIHGLADAAGVPGVTVYHAGTAFDESGRVVTAGGRVLGVTGLGATLGDARTAAYRGVEKIRFDGMQFRRDIGA